MKKCINIYIYIYICLHYIYILYIFVCIEIIVFIEVMTFALQSLLFASNSWHFVLHSYLSFWNHDFCQFSVPSLFIAVLLITIWGVYFSFLAAFWAGKNKIDPFNYLGPCWAICPHLGPLDSAFRRSWPKTKFTS